VLILMRFDCTSPHPHPHSREHLLSAGYLLFWSILSVIYVPFVVAFVEVVVLAVLAGTCLLYVDSAINPKCSQIKRDSAPY